MRGTGKTLVAVEFMPPSATATATAKFVGKRGRRSWPWN